MEWDQTDLMPPNGKRADCPADWDDEAQVRAFNLRGARMGLISPIFLDQLKFAAASGRLAELLRHCDVPAKELRFGHRAILFLGAPRGDLLRVESPWPPVLSRTARG